MEVGKQLFKKWEKLTAFEKWADDAATLPLSATVDLAALLFKSQILR